MIELHRDVAWEIDDDLWRRFKNDPAGVAPELTAILGAEEVDAIGLQLCEALNLPYDPPGPARKFGDAIEAFAGPATVFRVAELLLDPANRAEWKIEVAKAALEAPTVRNNVLRNLLTRDGGDWRLVSPPAPIPTLFELRDSISDFPISIIQRVIDDVAKRAMIEGVSLGRLPEDSWLRSSLTTVVFRVGDHFARIDPDDLVWVDVNSDPIETHRECRVAHPMEMTDDELEAWQRTFAEFEIAPRFNQLDRIVPILEEVLFGDLNVDTDHWQLISFLFPRGWTRYYESIDFEFSSRGWKLTLGTRLNDDMTRRMLGLSLSGFSGSSDVGKFECVVAAYDLLQEFAPDVFD